MALAASSSPRPVNNPQTIFDLAKSSSFGEEDQLRGLGPSLWFDRFCLSLRDTSESARSPHPVAGRAA